MVKLYTCDCKTDLLTEMTDLESAANAVLNDTKNNTIIKMDLSDGLVPHINEDSLLYIPRLEDLMLDAFKPKYNWMYGIKPNGDKCETSFVAPLAHFTVMQSNIDYYKGKPVWIYIWVAPFE